MFFSGHLKYQNSLLVRKDEIKVVINTDILFQSLAFEIAFAFLVLESVCEFWLKTESAVNSNMLLIRINLEKNVA